MIKQTLPFLFLILLVTGCSEDNKKTDTNTSTDSQEVPTIADYRKDPKRYEKQDSTYFIHLQELFVLGGQPAYDKYYDATRGHAPNPDEFRNGSEEYNKLYRAKRLWIKDRDSLRKIIQPKIYKFIDEVHRPAVDAKRKRHNIGYYDRKLLYSTHDGTGFYLDSALRAHSLEFLYDRYKDKIYIPILD